MPSRNQLSPEFLDRLEGAARLGASEEMVLQKFTVLSLIDAARHGLPGVAARELGRAGGLRGGKARAAALTPEQRTALALRAAKVRWGHTA